MLLVIIGVIIVIIGMVFWVKDNIYYFSFNTGMGMVLSTVGVVCICLGALFPIHGYYEPEFQEEYELAEILSDSNIYVIESQTGEKTFKYISKGEYEEQKNIENIYTVDKAEVVISKDGTKPVIRKYLIKAKKSIFALALGSNKEEYKIFVTEDNIER